MIQYCPEYHNQPASIFQIIACLCIISSEIFETAAEQVKYLVPSKQNCKFCVSSMNSSFEFPDSSCKFISVVHCKIQHCNQTNAIIQAYIAFKVKNRGFLDISKLIPVDTPKLESNFLMNQDHICLKLSSYLHSAQTQRLTRRAKVLYSRKLPEIALKFSRTNKDNITGNIFIKDSVTLAI